ncbi:leucyl aminopeptidase [Candidatus Endobugula sertula]|uniref:Probable cytosol aminopeptidase n=1 Tax=Candidatus Endobugula sertula TaxID=62101 RepID=A0A1D2QQW8_9GAMM|nr:leucyl aminopeptidase [Candidatus Endobugula sertula]
MNFITKTTSIDQIKSDCVVIGVYTNGQLSQSAEVFQQHSNISLNNLFDAGEISGKEAQIVTLYQPSSTIKKALIVGFGDKDQVTPESFRKSINELAKVLLKKPSKSVSLYIDEIAVNGWNSGDKARYCSERMTYASYRFTLDKTKKSKKSTISYQCEQISKTKKSLAIGVAVGNGVNIARTLGDLPGNICTPSYLANEARKLSRTHKTLTTKVLSEKQMANLGMDSLLSVSAGSTEAAQLIIMEYKGAAKSQKPHVLVGKGITFDTGGISLKSSDAMDEMKFDMCGAASVFGTLHTLIELKTKINVVAIIAAAENMPSGNATKPGDIITSMSGKTIEVLNTDAEGRLVLCDALTYAKHYKPQSVIDIATLTGACVVALGAHASGLFSNNNQLAESLLESGQNTGDRAWQMPIWEEYKEQLKSNFADLANIGGRTAGSITAACFLSHFTKDYPWAHLDIAGTAWLSGNDKGATGRPVPLLTDYLLKQAV